MPICLYRPPRPVLRCTKGRDVIGEPCCLSPQHLGWCRPYPPRPVTT